MTSRQLAEEAWAAITKPRPAPKGEALGGGAWLRRRAVPSESAEVADLKRRVEALEIRCDELAQLCADCCADLAQSLSECRGEVDHTAPVESEEPARALRPLRPWQNRTRRQTP